MSIASILYANMMVCRVSMALEWNVKLYIMQVGWIEKNKTKVLDGKIVSGFYVVFYDFQVIHLLIFLRVGERERKGFLFREYLPPPTGSDSVV